MAERTGRRGGGRWAGMAGAMLLLAVGVSTAQGAIDPGERAELWWDASRAERIGFSDRAASACRSSNCDSLQIRSCLNDTLKPPVSQAVGAKTLGQVTASCIATFRTKP